MIEMRFKAILETKGRNTRKTHRVWLLAVKHEGKLYFSRRNTNSDWLKNAQKNPDVKIEFDGQSFAEGLAWSVMILFARKYLN